MNVPKRRSILALAIVSYLAFVLVLPQRSSLALGEFVESGISLPGMHYSAADWGDYDNDGDLDLALIGQAGNTPSFKLYANLGNGSFSEVATNIPGRTYAYLSWVDYNGDGRLDLLVGGSLTGFGPGGVTTLYRNDNGLFSAVANTPFAGASYPAFDWADYDQDGDLDLLLAGRINVNNGVNVAHVYRNNGDDTFTTLQTNLAGIAWGVASWVDYDGDGHLDIFLTGCPDGDSCSSASTKLYRNTGSGAWAEVSTPFIQVGRSGADWGDYDNDGDLDLVIAGAWQPGRLYRNGGDGTFQNTGLSLPALGQTMLQWGDYDNDGLLDLAVAGLDSGINARTYIYHNTGSSTFTDISAGIVGVSNGGLGWGDYDNDGDLDLLATGCGGVYCPGTTKLYRNVAGAASPTPTATLVPTTTPTSTPTSTPTATLVPTTTPTSTPDTGLVTYLPLINNRHLVFLAAINPQAIPTRPVSYTGEMYYSTTIALSAPLPAEGHFYLSSMPDRVTPVRVDDELVVFVDGRRQFVAHLTEPAVVEIPRQELEQWLDRSIVVQFRDTLGAVVGSSPVWLIWVP